MCSTDLNLFVFLLESFRFYVFYTLLVIKDTVEIARLHWSTDVYDQYFVQLMYLYTHRAFLSRSMIIIISRKVKLANIGSY